jgi:hypothetical protein
MPPAGPVSVACTVHPDGSGFDVQMQGSIPVEGKLTITGPPGAVTLASGGSGISATLASAQQLGTYSSSQCTIVYTFESVPVTGTAITAGRIWGHLSCLDAQDPSTMVMTDAGTVVATCDVESELLFEDCMP